VHLELHLFGALVLQAVEPGPATPCHLGCAHITLHLHM
jgi:hypothetical protein